MALAENIKAKRLANGMTQEELSGMVGVARKQITCYESGERIPDLYNAIRLARALGTTIEELVENQTAPKQ